jgi:hypothetical protein
MGGKLSFSGWMLSGIEMITIPELVSQVLGSFLISETAPTGLWLAMKHPERVTAIATQNGNAYLEGLSKEWERWQAFWRDPASGPAHR